jgi:peroxiredoxin
MEAMNAIYAEIQKSGGSLVAISSQRVHQSSLMADQHKLRFPLLSDAQSNTARQFGLAYRVPEYQQEIYKRVFVNLPFVNGDDSWELPIPATYVLNGNGIIGYSSVNPDYTNRPEPVDIVGFLTHDSFASS